MCGCIRLPRHGASLPIGIGVSCSADRQILGKITADGVFLEELETNPARFLPEIDAASLGGDVVPIDLARPMDEIRRNLSKYPIKTRLSLTGPLIVARDIAHAKLQERLDRGEGLPDYVKDHPIYYAGPAKTPEGYASGSFGPTTAGRMDSYVDAFMAAGGSFVTLAKGNRGAEVRDACRKHGGFYLGSIGGPAARLAQDCIRKVELIEYPELGMEAIWRIEVVDFPAFIVIDDKGNDFFAGLALTARQRRAAGYAVAGCGALLIGARRRFGRPLAGRQGSLGGFCPAICRPRRCRRARRRARGGRGRRSGAGSLFAVVQGRFPAVAQLRPRPGRAVHLDHDRRAQHRAGCDAPVPADLGADRSGAGRPPGDRPGRAGTQAQAARSIVVAAPTGNLNDVVRS